MLIIAHNCLHPYLHFIFIYEGRIIGTRIPIIV